jgi:hypothetical protein
MGIRPNACGALIKVGFTWERNPKRRAYKALAVIQGLVIFFYFLLVRNFQSDIVTNRVRPELPVRNSSEELNCR